MIWIGNSCAKFGSNNIDIVKLGKEILRISIEGCVNSQMEWLFARTLIFEV